jgi:hypothetical protein
VHHAVNDRYLDRNYGGILIVWDRLFGSFEEEHDDEPCVYGARDALRSFNPLWANLQFYARMARDAWYTRSWWDKLRLWVMPPGWRPADVAVRFPKPEFRIEAVQRYDPMMSPRAQVAASLLFVMLLLGVCVLLWHSHQWSLPTLLGGTALVVAGLWLLGRFGEGVLIGGAAVAAPAAN